jgi:hypothetical protein
VVRGGAERACDVTIAHLTFARDALPLVQQGAVSEVHFVLAGHPPCQLTHLVSPHVAACGVVAAQIFVADSLFRFTTSGQAEAKLSREQDEARVSILRDVLLSGADTATAVADHKAAVKRLLAQRDRAKYYQDSCMDDVFRTRADQARAALLG